MRRALLEGVPLLGAIDPVARVWAVVAACGMLQSGVLMSVISRWDWKEQAKRVVKGIKARSD